MIRLTTSAVLLTSMLVGSYKWHLVCDGPAASYTGMGKLAVGTNELLASEYTKNSYHFDSLYCNVRHVENSCQTTAVLAGRHHRRVFNKVRLKHKSSVTHNDHSHETAAWSEW